MAFLILTSNLEKEQILFSTIILINMTEHVLEKIIFFPIMFCEKADLEN